MKKSILLASVSALAALTAAAQGATDVYQLSQNQLRGTARYISMGGAFGALGGDLSTLNQNPAGIGVYRSSEIGATLDIDFQRASMAGNTMTQTRAACNNFGYVGSVSTGSSIMPYFSWGATYNRVNSFNRRYRANLGSIDNSWTNYAAYVSTGIADKDLLGTDKYDPFFDSDVPWISALAYNSYLINPSSGYDPDNQNTWHYNGIFDAYSSGTAEVDVEQRGYIDEYSINFGGNFSNLVYWGLGFGITDLSFSESTYYREIIQDAPLLNYNQTGLVNGGADWGIENYQTVGGTGFNVKFGLIFKPVNEFRIGLAVHTPTWYNLNFTSNAWVDYDMVEYIGQDEYDNLRNSNSEPNDFATTQEGIWSRKLKTPWRLMASAAGVLGGRFIISADYVYEAYPSMTLSDDYGELDDVTADIKQYYSPSNELRIGAEMRVTPKFSIRAGYAYKSSGVKEQARNGEDYIYTTGTQAMYTMNNDRNNVSLGLGYRFGGFYIDAAYVHSTQKSEWSAFTTFPRANQGLDAYALEAGAISGPRETLTKTSNHLVLSVGFKF